MDRTNQVKQSIVTRRELLHNYLLKKTNKVAFEYKKAKYHKLKTCTLIVFTNTFNYSPIQTL